MMVRGFVRASLSLSLSLSPLLSLYHSIHLIYLGRRRDAGEPAAGVGGARHA